jgi:hypothetical protein
MFYNKTIICGIHTGKHPRFCQSLGLLKQKCNLKNEFKTETSKNLY